MYDSFMQEYNTQSLIGKLIIADRPVTELEKCDDLIFCWQSIGWLVGVETDVLDTYIDIVVRSSTQTQT